VPGKPRGKRSTGRSSGEISALLGGPQIATVRAGPTSLAFRIEDARNFCSNAPGDQLHVSAILARRLTTRRPISPI